MLCLLCEDIAPAQRRTAPECDHLSPVYRAKNYIISSCVFPWKRWPLVSSSSGPIPSLAAIRAGAICTAIIDHLDLFHRDTSLEHSGVPLLFVLRDREKIVLTCL